MVQVYYPQSLSLTNLDEYLADGWFRSCNMLFRSKIICLDNTIFSLVYLRLPLTDYHFSKSLRKLYKRNQPLFRHEIRKAFVCPEKQTMYHAHKDRFQGFVFDSLEHYFLGDALKSVFDTYEICIYEGDKLAAVSFFDVGDDSIASLLGLYKPEYAKHSLGIYSMLLEIELAQQQGKAFYYPGYILDQSSQFDYKLRLGKMQYYDWKHSWRPYTQFSRLHTEASKLRACIHDIQNYFEQFGIDSTCVTYPFFGMGYSIFFMGTLVRSAIFLQCSPTHSTSTRYIVEYILDEKLYALSSIRTYAEYGDMFEMDRYGQYVQHGSQVSELLCYEKMILKSPELNHIVQALLVRLI